MAKKKSEIVEEPIEDEVADEEPVVEAEPVTEEVLPTKPEDHLVIISELPTKQIRHAISYTDCEQLVKDWYNSLTVGQTFTLQEAADALEISVEDLRNSLFRLRNHGLPNQFAHISDFD